MDKKSKYNLRPPIVTLMGHVDHGKTTLLDTIRKSNITKGEHGGITQHIGAYQIIFKDKPITFIDTPGHAAFEKMRSRGADVADIVILVVAANDGVKPQTIEAIKHINKTQKPTIVAVTKVDLANINLEKIKKDLQKEGIVVEAFGGNSPFVEVSAPKNKGINELLEVIQLLWQMSPQPALVDDPLEAVVVESYADKNRGFIVGAIVKRGFLFKGQKLEVDEESTTVRALIDDRGNNLQKAGPGQPVEILGFKRILEVGSIISPKFNKRSTSSQTNATLAEIIAKSEEARDRFKIVIKADVAGSLEAIISNLPSKILVVASGIGEVNTADISQAKIAHAPILAFNIKVAPSVEKQADREGVVIKGYKVIYELLSDMEDIVLGFEQAKHESKITGKAKIVASFDIEGKKIAGVVVTSGKLRVGNTIFIKDTQKSEIKETKIISLKKFKKDVDTVSSGQQCGIGFNDNIDFKEGNVIESLG